MVVFLDKEGDVCFPNEVFGLRVLPPYLFAAAVAYGLAVARSFNDGLDGAFPSTIACLLLLA